MVVEIVLRRSPDECYREFCDVRTARLWLPGLKKVRVARDDARGRALEATYELGDALSYALVYAYDDEARKVRWVPSAGLLDGVSGYAEFAPHPEGCRFTYALESVRGRSPHHAEEVARAFAAYVARSQA